MTHRVRAMDVGQRRFTAWGQRLSHCWGGDYSFRDNPAKSGVLRKLQVFHASLWPILSLRHSCWILCSSNKTCTKVDTPVLIGKPLDISLEAV